MKGDMLYVVLACAVIMGWLFDWIMDVTPSEVRVRTVLRLFIVLVAVLAILLSGWRPEW